MRGVGQERLGPSYFFIPLMIGPLNSLVWYVPSSRYMEPGSVRRYDVGETWGGWDSIPIVVPLRWQVTRVPPYVRHVFSSKENRQIPERDDLGPPVVPGGQEIGLRSRNLRPRAEARPMGLGEVRDGQMCPPRRVTWPNGEWGQYSPSYTGARAPRGDVTPQGECAPAAVAASP